MTKKMIDPIKHKIKPTLKIDGVDDEFILAFHCPCATVLQSGYHYTYVDSKLDDNWKDTKNRFPLEDWDNVEDRYFSTYHHEQVYVYISRKGKIFIYTEEDDGCSDLNEVWYSGFALGYPVQEMTLEDSFEWMDDDYKDELNDPDKAYILDAQLDAGGHVNYILIDDPEFVEHVGNMPKNQIYQTVQDYIAKYPASKYEASHEVIKDGKRYDYWKGDK